MMNGASLKFKLTALFLLVGLVPVVVISFLAYYNAEGELREQVFAALDMYAGLTDDQLEDNYFPEREADARVLAATRDVYQSLNVLREEDWDISSDEWQERLEMLNSLLPTVVNEYGYAMVFISNPAGEVVYSTNQEIMGRDVSNRDYLQAALGGNLAWSGLYYSDITNENSIVVSVPVLTGGNSGNVIGSLNLQMDQRGINAAVHEGLQELGNTADAYLINADGLLLTDTLLGQYRENAALRERISTRAVELLAGPIRSGDMNFYAADEYVDYMGDMVLGQMEVTMLGDEPVGLVVEIDVDEAFAGVFLLRNMMVSVAVVAAVLVGILAFFVAISIVKPIQRISGTVKEIAAGDFTVEVDVASRDEIGQMAGNLNETVNRLSETLARVQASAESVTHSSTEIATGNQDLSQRTEEQASSLEEVASTIEEITSSLETSSANAVEADNLSRNTLSSVQKGEGVVGEMQVAMEEITRSSQEIAEIIAKVNDIAFQTNLLALNAAVEAARAGEQGRGFAVVAAEVRNLAGRAAESAQEIEKLIKDSIERVNRGNTLMGDTQSVLQEIVNNNRKATDVVSEIAASLGEQSVAAGDIRTAIEELNQVTQQNASLVEEIASSSENMSSEATDLSDRVSYFKINSNGQQRRRSKPATPAGYGPTGGIKGGQTGGHTGRQTGQRALATAHKAASGNGHPAQGAVGGAGKKRKQEYNQAYKHENEQEFDFDETEFEKF